jgi:3-hydroxyacyl-[acyl-carrier-protein] dehydratase
MRFLLIDRIEEVVPGRSARGWKNAAMSEDYFEWHFPERPIVPGMLVLESFAQLAGWAEAASSDFQRWFLLDRVKAARYYAFAGPGDRIDLTLETVACDDESRRAFRGESSVGGERSAVVEFEGCVVPLGDLENAQRARRTYAALRGEGS